MPNIAKTNVIVQAMTGKNAGNNIRIQDNDVQHAIGLAPGWNARIAIIAIDNTVPGHDMMLKFIEVLLFVELGSINI